MVLQSFLTAAVLDLMKEFGNALVFETPFRHRDLGRWPLHRWNGRGQRYPPESIRPCVPQAAYGLGGQIPIVWCRLDVITVATIENAYSQGFSNRELTRYSAPRRHAPEVWYWRQHHCRGKSERDCSPTEAHYPPEALVGGNCQGNGRRSRGLVGLGIHGRRRVEWVVSVTTSTGSGSILRREVDCAKLGPR
jgi:hypothetical protein